MGAAKFVLLDFDILILKINFANNFYMCLTNIFDHAGVIPHEIGNLFNLKILGLSTNQLKGHLPSSIGNLTHLRILNLYENSLTGII